MRAGDEPEHLAGGVIVGGFDGAVLPDVIRERLSRGLLAGVILFRRNIVDVVQVHTLCASIVAASRSIPPLLSIDQEGGRVARLRDGVTLLPPMRTLGRIDDPALTRRAALAVGRELAALGINLNFAPVCDVDSNPANPIIGDRSFGREVATVCRHVVAFNEGLEDAGVMGCAKHFPGHGDTETDSHMELPRLPHPIERLEQVELPPFRAAIRAGVASIMTAHVLFEAIDPERPATLSRRVVTDLLREGMGAHRDMVIFSDDLHMKALSEHWAIEEAAVQAIAAGCDALLVCTDPDSQERVRRTLATRARTDEVFAARLRDAHDRVARMRCRVPPRPVARTQQLLDVLRCPEHLAVLAELRERCDGG
jgi:beta-N-acetylhexosaminidase